MAKAGVFGVSDNRAGSAPKRLETNVNYNMDKAGTNKGRAGVFGIDGNVTKAGDNQRGAGRFPMGEGSVKDHTKDRNKSTSYGKG